MPRFPTLALAALFAAALAPATAAVAQDSLPTKPATKPKQPPPARSTLRGTTVTTHGGPTLSIPRTWVARHNEFGHSIYTKPFEKLGKQKTIGDFDAEYATLVNSVFELRHCAFQGGDDGWGKHGVGFTGLTMRIYLVPHSETAIEKRLDNEGAKALRSLLSPREVARRNALGNWLRSTPQELPKNPDPPPALEKFHPKRRILKAWRRSRWDFELHYGDYGAPARVEVHLQGQGPQTLAVVFLHSRVREHGQTKRTLLDSIRWPRAKKK